MFNRDRNWEISNFSGLVGPSVFVIEWPLGLAHSSSNRYTLKEITHKRCSCAFYGARKSCSAISGLEGRSRKCMLCFDSQRCNRHGSLDLASHLLLLFASRRAELVRDLTEQCCCFCTILTFVFFFNFIFNFYL